jgi:hypothetical protein
MRKVRHRITDYDATHCPTVLLLCNVIVSRWCMLGFVQVLSWSCLLITL